MEAIRMTHQVRGCYGFMVIFGQQTIKKSLMGRVNWDKKNNLPSHRPIKRRDITMIKWEINNYLEFASFY